MSRVIECKMRVISNFLLLLCIFRRIHGDVAEETEDKLSKFRDDINQISIDFENFVYDILKEALSGTDRIVNPLPQNNLIKMLNMNNPLLARKNFKDLLHKYAVKASPTTANPVEDYYDNFLEKTSNLMTKRPKTKRTKRSAENSICDQKTQREQLLERQHVEDLKEEVKKLNNLVMVLRDQHKIMSLLKPKVNADDDNHVIKPTHEELGQIKLDLQQMVVELNNTKEALLAAKEEEATLREEINRQKTEIKLVKLMVQQLYNRTTPRTIEDETVGAPMPKFPIIQPVFRKNNQSRESTLNDGRQPRARASELESLLKDLDKPSPDLSELVKKKTREDNIRKLLSAITNNHQEDSTSSTLLKKLMEASKAQSKSDDDVDKELEKLENAINSLRPIDNLELEDDLSKLVRGLGKGLEADQGGTRGLSQRQINELRRRLEQMSRAGAGAAMNGNGGWGYSSQGFALDKRGGYAPYQFPTYPNNFPIQPSSFPNEPFKSPNGFTYTQQLPGPNFPSTSPNMYQDPSFGPVRPYQQPLDLRGRPYPYRPFEDFKARPYGDDRGTLGPYGPKAYGGLDGPFGSLDYKGTSGPVDYKGRPNDASFGKPYGAYDLNPTSYPSETIKTSPIQKPSYPQQQQQGNYQSEPQFFPGAPQGNVYASDGADGSNPSQSGAYQAQNSYGADYKMKNVEELKTQVDALQGVINGLNYSGYKKPEDQQAIAGLEQQINELKGIINSLNQDGYDQAVPSNNQSTQPSYRRRKRSSDSELYDQVASNIKNFLFEPEKPVVEQVQARIDGVKSELGKRFSSPGARSAWYPDDTYKVNNGFDLVTTKKQDVFNSIVIKILDKVLGTIPAVLERLFGHGIYNLANFKDGYGVYDSQYELKGLFKSLGAFGYGPLIILKIIDGFTSFVNILRKNMFFKNFLVPALVLLIVAGSVIFIIWWLSPDSNDKQSYNNYYDGNDYYDKNYDRNARNRQSNNNIYVPSFNKNPLNYEVHNNYDKIGKNSDRDVIYGRIYYPIPYKNSDYKQNYDTHSTINEGHDNYIYKKGHNYEMNDVYSRNHGYIPNGNVEHGIYRTYLE